MSERAGPEIVHPDGWVQPKGYSNGVLAPPGARILFVAGQVAWDARGRLVGAGDFAAQFEQALGNVLDVVRAAGGKPEDVARLTVFVSDKRAYAAVLKELGLIWRRLMGRHYPAMALVEVSALLEEGAMVEIEATAAIS